MYIMTVITIQRSEWEGDGGGGRGRGIVVNEY